MNIRHYWQNLLPRERRLMSVGGGGLLLALLYAYAWLPLQQQQQRLHASLPRVRVQAAQLQAARDEVLSLKARVGNTRNTALALRPALEQTSQALGITWERLDLNGERSANLVFNHVAFDTWLRWLNRLQTEQGVRATSVDILPSGTTGLVNIQLSLLQE